MQRLGSKTSKGLLGVGVALMLTLAPAATASAVVSWEPPSAGGGGQPIGTPIIKCTSIRGCTGR